MELEMIFQYSQLQICRSDGASYSLLLTPYSLLLTPCSLLPAPCSLLFRLLRKNWIAYIIFYRFEAVEKHP